MKLVRCITGGLTLLLGLSTLASSESGFAFGREAEVTTEDPAQSDATPTFVPTGPSRLLDTRAGQPTIDGQGHRGTIGTGQRIVVQIAGRASLPVRGVDAAALNITAITPGGSSWLTIWPTGSPQPLASSLNPAGADPTVNLVTSKVGVDGTISVYNAGAPTDVVADLAGWHPVGSDFTAVLPARLADTRPGGATVDGAVPLGKIGALATVRLKVAGRGGVPDHGASAVLLNLTVVNASAATYLTAWPAGQSRPTTSNLNPSGPAALAKSVVAPLGVDGSVDLYNAAGQVDLIVDVDGSFQTGGDLRSLSPSRLVDTRPGQRTVDGLGNRGAIGWGNTYTIQVAGRAGIPSTGVGVAYLNITSDQSSQATYLTAYQGGAFMPLASNLNPAGAAPTSNLVVVPLGPDGSIALFNRFGSTHIIIDVVAWYPVGTLIQGELVSGTVPQLPPLLVGQRARYSLTRAVGSRLSVAAKPGSGPPNVYCGAVLKAIRPDQTVAATTASPACDDGAAVELDLLIDQPGEWLVEYENRDYPRMFFAGRLWVADTLEAGALTLGTAVTLPKLARGQNVRWTFTPGIGQDLGVGLAYSNAVTTDARCDLTIRVSRPDGSVAATYAAPICNLMSPTSVGLSVLVNVGGPWTIEIDNGPLSDRDAGGQLAVTPTLDGGLVTLPAEINVPPRRLGQPMRWNFAATAGTEYTLFERMSNGTYSGGPCTSIALRKPDGSSAAIFPVCPGPSSSGSAAEHVFVADATGNWTLSIAGPVSESELRTGLIALSAPIVGQPANLPQQIALPALAPGQNYWQPFDATTGDNLSIGWDSIDSGVPAYCVRRIVLMRPDKTQAAFDDRCTRGFMNFIADVSGQWGILYDDRATGLAAAVGTLGISKETNLGLMAPDTPIALPVVVQGAGARFTMKLEAGQTYDAACSDGSTQVYCFVAAYRPDGSQDFLLSPTSTGVWTFHTLGLAPVTSITIWSSFDAGTLVRGVPAANPAVARGRSVTWKWPLVAGEAFSLSSYRLDLFRPDSSRYPDNTLLLDDSAIRPDVTGIWTVRLDPTRAQAPAGSFVLHPDVIKQYVVPEGDPFRSITVAIDGLRRYQSAWVMQQGPYYGSPSISNQDLWTGSRSVADFQLRGLTAWGDYFFVVSNYTDTAVGPFNVSWVF